MAATLQMFYLDNLQGRQYPSYAANRKSKQADGTERHVS